MTVTKTHRLRRNETKHSGQLKCAEGNQCGSSHPYRVLSLWRSNHHDLHRERSRRRQFLVMRSPVPWHMAVPPDDTTVAYQSLQKSTSRFIWREMPWISLAPLTGEILAGAKLPRNGHVRCDSVGVTVGKKLSLLLVYFHVRFEHCVAILISSLMEPTQSVHSCAHRIPWKMVVPLESTT